MRAFHKKALIHVGCELSRCVRKCPIRPEEDGARLLPGQRVRLAATGLGRAT